MPDDISKQLTDQGAVIGYKPDIQYSKEIKESSRMSGSVSNEGYINNLTNRYSKTVQSLLENAPFEAVSSISDSINNIKDVINRLKEAFKEQESNWSQYGNIEMFIEAIDIKDSSYVEKFLDFHMNNVEGSSIPEICYFLKTEETRLNILQNTLKTLYYGSETVSDQYMITQDDSYKKMITKYESDDEKFKINYLALVNDSKINRSVITYSSQVRASVCDLEDVIYKEDAATLLEDSASEILNEMFSKINTSIKDRNYAYNDQHSLDTMEKTLYNYYDKRKRMLDYYSLAINAGSDSFLITKIQAFEDDLDNAVTNLNRVLIGNVYYLQSIASLEVEKQYLRSISETISYNY